LPRDDRVRAGVGPELGAVEGDASQTIQPHARRDAEEPFPDRFEELPLLGTGRAQGAITGSLSACEEEIR